MAMNAEQLTQAVQLAAGQIQQLTGQLEESRNEVIGLRMIAEQTREAVRMGGGKGERG